MLGSNSDLTSQSRAREAETPAAVDRKSRIKGNLNHLWNHTPYLRIGVGVVAVGLLIVGLLPSGNSPATSNAPSSSTTAASGGGSAYAPSQPIQGMGAPAATPTQAFAPPTAPSWMTSAPADSSQSQQSTPSSQAAFQAGPQAQSQPQEITLSSSIGPITIEGSQTLETPAKDKNAIAVTKNTVGAKESESPSEKPAVGLDEVFKKN